MLQIYCKNTGETASVEPGTTLLGAAGKFGLDMPYGLVSARVNNVAEGLNFRLYKNKDVEYLDVRDMSAMRTYVRSLCFILCKAVADLYPMGGIKLEHVADVMTTGVDGIAIVSAVCGSPNPEAAARALRTALKATGV